MELSLLVGIIGATMYSLSYFLLITGSIHGNSMSYVLLNIIAAMCVLISFNIQFSLGAFLVQLVLFVLCWLAITERYLSRRQISLSVQEKQVADVLFPNLPYRDALKLIRKGVWKSENFGILADEGMPLANLSVLLSGTASVEKQGNQVASLNAGQTIGELSCLEDALATAKVQINSPAHYFAIPVDTLRGFLANNADAAVAFETGVRRQLSQKLT